MMGEQGSFDAVALKKYPQLETINHVHHAGNSSGIVDGAALTLIGSEKAGADMGLIPRARIVVTAVNGVEPAVREALAKANLTVDDIDVWEINEAFAAVVKHAQQNLGIDYEKLNIKGGAMAMGHPLGATGAMITGAAIDELHRISGRYGLISLCVAGGESGITGIIITPAKKTFFAGGDIKQMSKATEADAEAMFTMVEHMKESLRLEKLPVPIVAAINGAALGGGLEVALAANHRIAADARGSKIGLPEVTLALLPGGGGVSRVVRMIGIQNALMQVILTGAQMNPQPPSGTTPHVAGPPH
ncbi:acetyl-CoA thiolase [Corynebacterium diphtheriae]|nr:acetyl-CoA thiolase [Corynebacterium diphtheriae]CAB0614995.1 acetyl-CoA thiolase [Corynebacterium diphtheriae]CAB0621347.1 acetyl-CoA thiolase [Corynebacterium diphtheriae]VEJ66399.1 acetyl-CoA thiolase [Corynebacterium diphtheriae]